MSSTFVPEWDCFPDGLSAADRLILLRLIHHTNDTHGRCWPSVK